jgi:DNA-binding CsgD family transcriptional regulator
VAEYDIVANVPNIEDIEQELDREGPAPEVGPFMELLQHEVSLIPKIAHMTGLQAQIFTANIYGHSNRKIALVLDISEAVVREHLSVAVRKANRVKYRGLISVLIAEFGWAAVRDALRLE